jgi:hypothetical protein
MAATPVNEKMRGPASDYALGYSESEHERLIRQAALIAPITERHFREAGIGQASAFWIWVPAWATSACWLQSWSALPVGSLAWNAMLARLHEQSFA